MDSVDIGFNNEDPAKNSMEYHRLETESDNSIYELILRGFKRKPGTKIWERSIGSPNRYDMTDDAVSQVIATRVALVNKAVIQGSLTGQLKWKMFDDVVMHYMNAYDEQLTIKGEDYNLSVSECTMISEEMEEYLRMILTRTINDGERKRDQSHEDISNLSDDDNKKKSMWK